MTITEPGSADAQIVCLLAGQMDDSHLGKHVAFYAGGKRWFGELVSVYRPRQGVRTITLSSGRVRDVSSSTEVDVITEGATS